MALSFCGLWLPEATAQTTLSIARAIEGDGSYTAGDVLDIVVTFTKTGDDPFTQMGLEETLPTGWSFVSVVGGPAPEVQPAAGSDGTLSFGWVFPPDPPFNLIYRVEVPLGTTGAQTLSGFGIYATLGPQETTATVETAVPFGGSVGEGEVEGAPEGEVEGEGEGTPEGEGETETTVTLAREVANGGEYSPGCTLDITVTLSRTGADPISQLGLSETLPPGWTFRRLVSGDQPPIAPSAGTAGTINFAYIIVPAFPVQFTYRVNVPPSATGALQISGQGIYATDGPQEFTAIVVSPLTEGEPVGEGELEGEGEGEEEGEVEGLELTMAAPAGAYVPGGVLDVQVRLRYTAPEAMTALGLQQTLPAGWTFNSVVSGSAPQFSPAPGSGGTLEFAWILIPSFPSTFVYRVNVPESATGLRTITGQANYRTGGGQLLSNVAGVAVPQGEGDPEGEGEAEGEGEGEGQAEGEGEPVDLVFGRGAPGGTTYLPGGEVEFEITLNYGGAGSLTGLAVEERYPEGWTFEGITGGTAPNVVPGAGSAPPFGFAWIVVPSFPVTFRYRARAPLDATGDQAVSGNAAYREDGPELTSNVVDTVLTPREASALAVAVTEAPDALWVGQAGDVAYTVRNEGTEELTAPWDDCVYLSDDDQPEGDTELVCATRASSLAVGASYDAALAFSVPDVAPGEYWLVVAADTTGGALANTAVVGPIAVGVIDYGASVTASVEELPDGSRQLRLEGVTADLDDAGAVPGVPVDLDIVLRDAVRRVQVIAGGDGTFSTVFPLLPGEAGDYDVVARHPGLPADEADTALEVAGLLLSAPSATPRLVAGVGSNVSVTLRNTGNVALSGLTLVATDAPDGLSVIGSLPATLEAGAAATVTLNLTAATTSVPGGTVTVRVESDEGAFAQAPIRYSLRSPGVNLVPESAVLHAGALPGEQAYFTFDVTNDGSGNASGFAVSLPDVPWVHLVAPAAPLTLGAGQTQTVTLLLSPPAAQAQGLIETSLDLVANGAEAVSVPLEIAVVQERLGLLRARVSDELTVLDPLGTAVAGAEVRALAPGTGVVLASGETDANGEVLLPDLEPGLVDVEARAPGHGVARGVAVVGVGATRDVALFLPRQVVGQTWTAATDPNGRVVVDFEVVPATDLAAPVVSLDPPVLDVRDMETAVVQRDLLITNDGLAPAYNLALQFADHPRFSLRPMVDVLGILEPGGSFLVPVLVEDLAFGEPALATDCDVPLASGLRYGTGSGLGNDQRFVPVALLLPDALCPGALPQYGAPPLPTDGVTIHPDQIERAVGDFCPEGAEPEGEGEGTTEGEGEGAVEGEGEGEGEGTPEGEGEPEGEAETVVTLARAGVGGNTYTAGLPLDIVLSLSATGSKPLTSLGVREFLPEGWVFQSIVGGSAPQLGPTPGSTGDLDFVWFVIPAFPFSVTYRVTVPLGETGPEVVDGEAIWSTDGPQFGTGIVSTEFNPSGKAGVLGSLAGNDAKALDGLCARAALRPRSTVVSTNRSILFDTLLSAGPEEGLSSVAFNVRVTDSEGQTVGGLFSLSQTGLTGLSGGAVPAGETATAAWSLSPTPAAAGDGPQYYRLGGSVAFTRDGAATELDLPEAVITVLPAWEADVDLFVPEQVFGDSATTEGVDETEDFPVGVLLRNQGDRALEAPTVRLMDPYFVDETTGEASPAVLQAAAVNAASNAPLRLRAAFGSLAAGGVGQAVWRMTPSGSASLDGLDFAVTARMPDGFRAVLEPASVVQHDLVRMVRLDTPEDDGLDDFLVSDIPDSGRIPDTLYGSDGQVLALNAATDIEIAFEAKQFERNFTLDAQLPAGWGYVLTGIPADASYGLVAVRRADDSVVRAENVWVTRRTVLDPQDQPVLEERLHFIDFNAAAGAREYRLEFERLPGFNTVPVADAGPDQTRLLEETIFLSGEGSFDEDGDPLTYAWTVVTRPAGSTAQLQGATTQTPTLDPDRRGTYVFQLIVSDGVDSSAPDTVTVEIENRAPVAATGAGFAVGLGERATLSGAGSSDPDGDTLQYAWSFASRPSGSTTTLQSANTVAPSFVLDVRGAYVVQLIVSDGDLESPPATVEIRTTNARPVANAGPAQSVALGSQVTLNGAGSSDPDGDTLDFAWTFSSRPAGSQAVLQAADTAQPRFTADVPGSYLVQLIVRDAALSSTPSLVTITTTNTRPVANAGPNRGGRVGDTVQLDGSGSSDPDGNSLTYEWSVVSRPAGSTAALSSTTAVRPNFRIDEAGNYVFSLVVRDGTLSSTPATVSVSTLNSPPVANAGADQRLRVGDVVTLDGGASTDVDDNPLSFRWAFTSRPAGSTASLSNPQAVSTQFTIDQPGDYAVELIVNDGTIDSEPATVRISTDNTAPRADAGDDRTVAVGASVVLDGSGSSDADNDELTYQWSFVSRAEGSAAILTDARTVSPRFTVDVAGDYVVRLVVNDGRVNSAPATVTLSTRNSAPRADAGSNISAQVGETVVLDGSGSSDADSDPLTYRWSLSVRPAGSAAALLQPNTVNPRFTVDRAGEYVAQLIVNDGTVDSAPTTVRVSTTNTAPVANPGPNQSRQVGDRVQLSAAASVDADNDALSYRWSFVSRPEGSAAVIEAPAAVSTAFTIDESGTYVVQLVVNDGKVDSEPSTVRVTTGNSAPVADAGADRSAQFGAVITLDGSGSSDPDGDSLTYAWSFTSRPPASSAALSSQTAVSPTFTIDAAGTYVVQLIVSDGTQFSPADRVTISTENSPPVAVPGPDQTRLVGQLAQLDGGGSFDPDGAALSYAWSFVSRPQASGEALVGPTTARPSFRVDIAGTYVVQLIVSDGTFSSAPATLTISTENSRPVANAGLDQSVRVGSRVQLDGSASLDPDGGTLTYQWTLTTRPTGSAAIMQSGGSARPTFTADIAGQYVAQLVVNDGALASLPATMRVFADDSGPCDSPPAAPANVSATDGAFADRVAVTWTSGGNGLQYRVWRGNSADPSSAQPVSGWISDLLYNDTGAPSPTVADAAGCACGGAPDVNFVVRQYFVEARSGSECVSPLSNPDAGYRGAASKALAEPAEKVAVAGLPSAVVDDLTRMAQPDSALHLRLRHDSEDLAEVWGSVSWSGGTADATQWVAANGEDARDGWLVFTPEQPWPVGDTVTFSGGGRTVSGAPLPAAVQQFEIWPKQTVLEADVEVRWLGDGLLPELFGGRGVAYDLVPAAAYAEPVAVMLPVPAGVAAEDAALYLYYHDATGPGWYAAGDVLGWIVPGSVQVTRSGDQDWIYFEARHGGVVQVGRAPGSMEAASLGAPAAGRAGDLVVLGLMLLLFAAARPARGVRRASRR